MAVGLNEELIVGENRCRARIESFGPVNRLIAMREILRYLVRMLRARSRCEGEVAVEMTSFTVELSISSPSFHKHALMLSP